MNGRFAGETAETGHDLLPWHSLANAAGEDVLTCLFRQLGVCRHILLGNDAALTLDMIAGSK